MENRKTVVLVLRTSNDFTFDDVLLISRHINGKWGDKERPRVICLWDKATTSYSIGSLEIIPLTNPWPGTWSRMILYSPEMEQYKPFLYVDLDTAVITSLENIFKLVINPNYFITLEDFWQKGQLATGLVWFPANCEKTNKVWRQWKGDTGGSKRMDFFLRKHIQPDKYWQQLTSTVLDFKPKAGELLLSLPNNADLVCFHGKPRIHQAAYASMSIPWVHDYVEQEDFSKLKNKKKVTVIIPYKEDRGWLKEAVLSVPTDVQLILSQGPGNWPQNFNKALPMAEGEYIKYLHEDDKLTENCIRDSLRAFETTGADFIHGDAIELVMSTLSEKIWRCPNKNVTLNELLLKNTIHSATLMYRKEIFEQIGGFDETLECQEEYEFNLRCLQAGFQIGYCPSTLAVYRRHPKQKIRTVSKEVQSKEKQQVKDKYK